MCRPLKELEIKIIKINRLFSAAAAAVALFAICPKAQAQVAEDGSASLSVLKALTLSETTPMSWGSIARPGNGAATYTLDYATGAVTLTSSTSTLYPGFAVNNGAAGDWAVTGEASTGVSFSVSLAAFDGTGVSVSAAHINGTSNSGTDTLNGSGNLSLKLGGVVVITAAANLGLHTSVVTVTVDYS